MTQGLQEVADQDEKIQCVLCRVAKHEGESEYWEINKEGQISIDVITLKTHNPLTAILRGGDVNSKGVWMIPAEGTECVVSFDIDGYEGDAVLVGLIGQAPSSIDAARILILHDTVEIRSVDGTAVSLAKKSDAQSAASWDANHVHLDSTGMPTSGPLANATLGSGILTNPAFPGDPRPFIPGASPTGATIAGTDVLKGE